MFAPISVPETQPATELVDGYLVQKKGGELRHQHEFTAPGHCFALLVPDVAFQSAETLVKARSRRIRSAGMCAAGCRRDPLGRRAGLAAGLGNRRVSRCGYLVVDPPRRTVVAYAADGVTRFGPRETVRHPALPEFAFTIDEMFEGLYLG